jgi:serine/threonine protein kinase
MSSSEKEASITNGDDKALQDTVDTISQTMDEVEDDDEEEAESEGSSRYSIERKLRDTNQGAVHLAWDHDFSRQVVIKQCLWKCVTENTTLKKQSVLENPRNEIWVMQHEQLKHPNLLQLFEVMQDDENLWLVLEYATEGDLFDLLQFGPIRLSLTRMYFLQLLQAINHLHLHGVYHMDVSKENLLITKVSTATTISGDSDSKEDDNNVTKFQVKLCDFGLVAFASNETDMVLRYSKERGLPGKVRYMSPELWYHSTCYGNLNDSYSAGIVLFNMLFAEDPYEQPGDANFHCLFSKSVEQIREYIHRRNLSINNDFPSPDAQNMELLALDLMSRLLRPYDQRLSAADAINHPWFNGLH